MSVCFAIHVQARCADLWGLRQPGHCFPVMGKLPACSGADRLTEVDRLKLVLDCERLQNVTEVA